MISYLRGKITQSSPTELTIEVNGVGYLVYIPLSTYERIGQNDQEMTTILTHLHVREDLMQLFGFATEQERELFRLLISVSGIGPKMAQSILSGISPADLRAAILEGNLLALTSISGVGRKTAERIVLELRSKLGKLEFVPESATTPTSLQMKARSEALVGLMSLGYTRASAEKALRAVLNESPNKDLSTEELIKRSLRHATK